MRAEACLRWARVGFGALAVCVGTLGCAMRAEPEPLELPRPEPARPRASSGRPPVPSLLSISESEPVPEGRVDFAGMLQGTKGGYLLRGVIIEDTSLERAVEVAAGRSLYEQVGAKARVVCTVVRRESPPEEHVPGQIAEQRRSGSWLECDRVERAEIVAPPQVLEGELGRSKGFFTLEGRLVSSSDLRRLLRGEVRAGERVRLHGQERDYVCGPQEQCLIGGSLPLFDLARAERLP